jgi:hypothetical protein
MAFPAFLAPLIKPFLTGAATGGVLGLATGRDPLKSALMGGVMGGVGSKISGALSGADSVGANLSAGAQPTSFMPPTMPETGAFNSFDFATNAPMGDPAASIIGSTGEMAPNMGFVQPMTQGVQDFSPLMTRGGASAGGLSVDPAASGFSRFLDGLPDYVTPENVLGAANILSQSQPQQMPMPTSSASVSRGTPRQGAIDYGMAQPIKRRGLL